MNDFLERRLALVEQLETAFEEVVIRELRRVLRVGGAGLGELVASGADAVSQDDLAVVGTAWRETVAETLLPLVQDAYAAGAESSALSLLGVAQVPDVAQRVGEEWIAGASNRLVRIGDEAWQNARTALLDGFQAGDDIGRLKRRVRESLDVTNARAKTIARTTIIGASNAGSLVSAADAGAEKKTWLATGDGRTRATHVEAGGQTLELTEPFQVGGSLLQYPGDPTGAASQVVNCRCTLIYDDSPSCMCVPSWAGGLTAATPVSKSNCECSETPSPPEPVSVGGNAKDVLRRAKERLVAQRDATNAARNSMLEAHTGYVGGDYRDMNGALRGTADLSAAKRQEVMMKVGHMDRAFDEMGVANDELIIVHRGLKNDAFERYRSAPLGTELTDDGFMSTTTDRRTAEGFSDDNFEGDALTLLIRVPPGRRSVIGHPNEDELIYPRGTTVRVTGTANFGRTVVVEMV